MARIIILAARNWEIQDSKTGEWNRGVNLDGCEGFQNEEKDYRGRGGVAYRASDAAWAVLKDKTLPAICEVDLGTRKGKNKTGQAVAMASVEQVFAVHPIDFNVPELTRKAAA